MKVYVDNYRYFIDMISTDSNFKSVMHNLIEIDGVISPPNFLTSTFLKNDNELNSIDNIKQTIRNNYHQLFLEHEVVENPEEADIWYIHVQNINFFELIDKYEINKKIINNLQLQKCKLLINIPDDGWFASKNNNTLENLQRWLKNNNILEKNVYVMNLNLISNERKTEINMITDTIMSEEYLQGPPKEVCKFDKIDSLFLNYNRAIKSHKLYLGYSLFNNDLIQNSLFSFNDKYLDNESIGKDYTYFNFKFDVLYKFLKNLPYKIDNKELESMEDQGMIGQMIEHSDYEKTFLSLVSESTCEEGVVYLSEKTFKPIAMGHPFIIAGSSKSLKKLKEIVDILLWLKTKNYKELIIIRKEMQEIINHNFKLFNKRINEKNNENSFSNRL